MKAGGKGRHCEPSRKGIPLPRVLAANTAQSSTPVNLQSDRVLQDGRRWSKQTEIVRSITAIHHEKTGAPRYLIQVIFYAVAPDSHYVIGRPEPANQIWILIGQDD